MITVKIDDQRFDYAQKQRLGIFMKETEYLTLAEMVQLLKFQQKHNGAGIIRE